MSEILHKLRGELAIAAQKVYDDWGQNEEGYCDYLGYGGICQDIADEFCSVLNNHDITCTAVSQEMGEQHVYTVAQMDDGIYIVDINPYRYERGGGYCWKKIPDVIFRESDIIISQISPDPEDFKDYWMDEGKKVISKKNLIQEVFKRLIKENVQLLDKYYMRTGLMDDKDKQAILNITNGDNFTKIIADIYYYWKSRGHLDQGVLDDLEYHVYSELVNYDKNVLPIRGFNDIYNLESNKSNPNQLNLFGDQPEESFDIFDLLGGLRYRSWAIQRLKKIPALYLRNLRGDIRKPRVQYEFDSLKSKLSSIVDWMEVIEKNNPDYAEKTFAKTFSSKNDTFEKVYEHMQELRDYLVSDADSMTELTDKLSMADSSKMVYNKNNLAIIKVGSNVDMQNLGCGSLWCFARAGDREFWDDYASAGYVYLIYDFNKPVNDPHRMVVFLPQTYEYYNMYNEPTDEVDYSQFFPQKRRKVAE